MQGAAATGAATGSPDTAWDKPPPLQLKILSALPGVVESIHFSLATDWLRGTVKMDPPAPATPYKIFASTNIF